MKPRSSAFLMLGTIGPAYVTRVLGIQADDLGFIMAPAGLGMVAGLVLVTRLARAENRERMIDLGLLGAGLATLVFALTQPVLAGLAGLAGGEPPLPLTMGAAMLMVALMGGSTAFILVPAQTVLQERSPEHARARVYAAFYTVSSAVALGPVLFAGAIGDLFGVTTVLVIVGLTFALIGGLGRVRARPR
jgi:MFS family permease